MIIMMRFKTFTLPETLPLRESQRDRPCTNCASIPLAIYQWQKAKSLQVQVLLTELTQLM